MQSPTGKNKAFLLNKLHTGSTSIGDEEYFEFFALPFDRHSNPGAIKGVLFDTNECYEKGSIWDMMEKKRVIAYGIYKIVYRE